jgi:hypothetical protein
LHYGQLQRPWEGHLPYVFGKHQEHHWKGKSDKMDNGYKVPSHMVYRHEMFR